MSNFRKGFLSVISLLLVFCVSSCASVDFASSSSNTSSAVSSKTPKSEKQTSSEDAKKQYLEYKNYKCRVTLLDGWKKKMVQEIMMALNPDFSEKIDMYSLIHMDAFNDIDKSILEDEELMEVFLTYYSVLFWENYLPVCFDYYSDVELTDVDSAVKTIEVKDYTCLYLNSTCKYEGKRCYFNCALILSDTPIMIINISEENSTKMFDKIVDSFEFYD